MIGYSWLIYGDIRVGKTTLAVTAPGPRLFLDAEGRGDTVPGKSVHWDGKGSFPEVDEHTTVVLKCPSASALATVISWIKSGKLDNVKSVILDSVTMLQQNEVDNTFQGIMERQHWGQLLKMIAPHLRALLTHCKSENTPLECVVFTTWLREYGTESQMRIKPDIQGQLQKNLAHLTDTVGYLTVKGAGQNKKRVLQIEPTGGVTAGTSYSALDKYSGFIQEPNISNLTEEIRNV